MASIRCIKIINEIPLSSMPLNKNFTSVNSRKKSFKGYKGNLKRKHLAKNLGLFYVPGTNLLFCFNCGLDTPLNDDHTLPFGVINHSARCSYLPADALPLDYDFQEDQVKLKESSGTPVMLKDSKSATDYKGEGTTQLTMNSLEDVKKETVEEKNREVAEIIAANEDIYDYDSDSEDEEVSGFFWNCKICGQDRGCKLINIPCWHRTFCALCTANFPKNQEIKCWFCKEKVMCFRELVLTASPDTTIRIWDVGTCQTVQIIHAHDEPVIGLSLHLTGDFCFQLHFTNFGPFLIFELGNLLKVADDNASSGTGLTTAQFHPDGLIFGTGTSNSQIKIWDLKEESNVHNFTGHSGLVTAISFLKVVIIWPGSGRRLR